MEKTEQLGCSESWQEEENINWFGRKYWTQDICIRKRANFIMNSFDLVQFW